MEERIVKFQIVKPNKQREYLSKRYNINDPADLHVYEQLRAGSIVVWKNQLRRLIFGKLKNFIDKKLIYVETAKALDRQGLEISFPTEIEIHKRELEAKKIAMSDETKKKEEKRYNKARENEHNLAEDEPYLRENYTLSFSEYVKFLIENTVGAAGLGSPTGNSPVIPSVFSSDNIYAPGDNRVPKVLGDKTKKKKKKKKAKKEPSSYLMWKRNLKETM